MFDFLVCVLLGVVILLLWSLGNMMLKNFQYMQKMMMPIHISMRAILAYIIQQLKAFWYFLKNMLRRNKGKLLNFHEKEIENLFTQLEIIALEN